jgi:hypothetical protein
MQQKNSDRIDWTGRGPSPVKRKFIVKIISKKITRKKKDSKPAPEYTKYSQ